jgi:hypothetical protein
MLDAFGDIMRTTLSIDDDILIAAKAIARQERRSVGDVVSDLARRALRKPEPPRHRNGIALLSRGDERALVTLETVNALRDELP